MPDDSTTGLAPGVYVEEVLSRVKSIEGVSTSAAALIGPVGSSVRPEAPIGVPTRVRSWAEYRATFGGIPCADDPLTAAAHAFFLNGGNDAWIGCLATSDGSAPGAPEVDACFAKLKESRAIGVVLLPGQHLAEDGSENPAITAALRHCEGCGDRMLLIDPPPDLDLTQVADWAALGVPRSSYAALYYPWVTMAFPYRGEAPALPGDTTFSIAPSALVAGVWARTDGTRGVWKAPAGLDASLRGVVGLRHQVDDAEQAPLNAAGVNCLRTFGHDQPVVWGARTLAGAGSEWRYLPVRRTAMYIESSIANGIQWAVFEPNDESLWSSLRSTIDNFMTTLFRNGAFQGRKPSEAYFVQCGLGETMTQTDLDLGQVVIQVGFALLKPAEFIVARIRQKTVPRT